VGAAKAGTTSLYSYLLQHPSIYMSPVKEPHYFSTDIRADNFTQKQYQKNHLNIARYLQEKPLKPRHIAFVNKYDDYLALFGQARCETVLGEASTGYLYSETAATNIHMFDPNAKIIIILRNPVDRAYSHWKMNYSAGRERRTASLCESIRADYECTNKGWGKSNLYVELGLYCRQVERFCELFLGSNLKICFYHDLERQPGQFMQELFQFLNLPSIDLDVTKKHNSSLMPKYSFISWLNRKYGMGRFVPVQLRAKLKKITSSTQFPVFCNKERKEIYQIYFERDVESLERLLNRDLPEFKYG
jgi:hypothetical protein